MKAVQRAAEKATNNNDKDKSDSIAVLSDPNNPDRVRIASYPSGNDTSEGLAAWLP